MLPKATLVAVVAIGLGAGGLVSLLQRRSFAFPLSVSSAAVLAFATTAVLATITSDRQLHSLIGTYGRYSGLAPYLSYVILFFAVVAAYSAYAAALWRRTLLIASGIVTTYGLLQGLGFKPLEFLDQGLPGAFATLGNVNFAGAWTGAVSALALTTAATREELQWWRVYAGALLVANVMYAFVTTTSQALVVLTLSLGWVGLALLVTRLASIKSVRNRRHVAIAGLAALIALVASVAWLLRSRVVSALDQALVERPHFWAAAIDIWRDHPLFGTGLDTYGQYFLLYRPASHALLEGAGSADSAHSVPLAMLSNGGVLLAGAYLGFVLAVGVALLKGIRHGNENSRAVVAAWGGVWLGYQVQSLVSFDVPPLAVLHFISAGVIVTATGTVRWREIRLAGGLTRRRSRNASAPARRTRARVIAALVCVVAVVLGWLTLYPLRADLRASFGASLTQRGLYVEAADVLVDAASLNPVEGSYAYLEARSYAAAGQLAAARMAAVEAAKRDPGVPSYAFFVAMLAAEMDDRSLAEKWFHEAARRDPKNPEVLEQVAEALRSLDAGDAAQYEHRAARLRGSVVR